MPSVLLDQTCVLVDLRADGVLRGLGHDPTMTARPATASVELNGGGKRGTVVASFPVKDIEPPRDMDPADRDKMRQNMMGAEVLDAARFPTVAVQGQYKGTLEEGVFAGDLILKGARKAFSMPVRVHREAEVLVASGTWEGTLTGLGIKPYKALLGALRLKDWIRLRVEMRVSTPR
jgi:hypothetical protein